MALRLFSDVKVKLVVLILAVLYSLNFLFWNVDLVDNFYWINKGNAPTITVIMIKIIYLFISYNFNLLSLILFPR